jgi:hypothetical protein
MVQTYQLIPSKSISYPGNIPCRGIAAAAASLQQNLGRGEQDQDSGSSGFSS